MKTYQIKVSFIHQASITKKIEALDNLAAIRKVINGLGVLEKDFVIGVSIENFQ